MIVPSNSIVFALVFLSIPAFASPINFRRAAISQCAIDLYANIIDAQSGYEFYQAAKEAMKEHHHAVMYPLIDHAVDTYHRNNMQNNMHKNTKGNKVIENVRDAIHTKHVVQSNHLEQMRLNNRLRDLQNPYHQVVHNVIQDHQHPRELEEMETLD